MTIHKFLDWEQEYGSIRWTMKNLGRSFEMPSSQTHERFPPMYACRRDVSAASAYIKQNNFIISDHAQRDIIAIYEKTSEISDSGEDKSLYDTISTRFSRNVKHY